MNRVKLILLTCPAFLALMLLLATPVHATELVAQAQPTDTDVSAPATPIFEVLFEQETSDYPMLDSSDTVGDAAIDKFGCDCSGCRNTILNMQGKLPLL